MTDDDATLGEVQKACGAIIKEVEAAFEKEEISGSLAVGMNLFLTAYSMKKSYQVSALTIVNVYCDETGYNFALLDEQVQARIYERVQLDRIEKGLT